MSIDNFPVQEESFLSLPSYELYISVTKLGEFSVFYCTRHLSTVNYRFTLKGCHHLYCYKQSNLTRFPQKPTPIVILRSCYGSILSSIRVTPAGDIWVVNKQLSECFFFFFVGINSVSSCLVHFKLVFILIILFAWISENCSFLEWPLNPSSFVCLCREGWSSGSAGQCTSGRQRALRFSRGDGEACCVQSTNRRASALLQLCEHAETCAG